MPQHKKKEGRDLSIELEDPSAPLYPGSVVRKHPIGEYVNINVRLLGRAKGKLYHPGIKDGRAGTVRTGSPFWNRPDFTVNFRNTFADVNVRGRPRRWKFEIMIPKVTQRLTDPGEEQNEGFAVVGHALPPSNAWKASHLSKSLEVYVEYWLEAVMRPTQPPRYSEEATLPLRVLEMPSLMPISNFELRGLRFPVSVTGPKDCCWGKMEEMHCLLSVDCPSILQFGAAVPFGIKLMLVGSSAIKHFNNVLPMPKVCVTSAYFKILTETQIPDPLIQKGSLFTWAARLDEEIEGRDTRSCDAREAMIGPVGSSEKSLDLGRVMGLRLDVDGSLNGAWFRTASRRTRPVQTVTPQFTTYTMRTKKALFWDITLSIGGRKAWICSPERATLLPAAAEKTTSVAPAPAPTATFTTTISSLANGELVVHRSTPRAELGNKTETADSRRYDYMYRVKGNRPPLYDAIPRAEQAVVRPLGDEGKAEDSDDGYDVDDTPVSSVRSLSMDRSTAYVASEILRRYTSNHMYVAD
ncbi:hypothetical protein CSOJ01_15064 [Colletotrichum sojae]|uniref:Arrestin-like N-terminal domain-containing protein n=1 Tax=Colletotrichum sojae TaxID=2175907 RepID=A0A8H6IN87_9PEZI|nr:hypothetical protein CSOJ01_15064 [Colletotrichum sojae]